MQIHLGSMFHLLSEQLGNVSKPHVVQSHASVYMILNPKQTSQMCSREIFKKGIQC